jgi:methylmalonyl-CoA mutase
MSGSSDDVLVLGGEFPTPTRDQWLALAEAVLKGKPFDKVLVSRLYDGIDVQPLYTEGDAPTASDPVGVPGAAPFVRGSSPVSSGWDICQRVDVGADTGVANVQVLAELEKGATSIVLGLRGATGSLDRVLAEVLDGVYLELAGIVLDAGPAFGAAAAALHGVAKAGDVAPSALLGTLGADPIGHGGDLAEAVTLASAAVAQQSGLRTFAVDGTVWHDAGASDVEELGCALATALHYLRALVDAGLDLAAAAAQIEVRYAINADQFAGIAKLRAARRLWARVTEVSGAAQPQRQHAVTSSAMMTQRDPWVNLLRTTIACFAAGTGGADAITVQPFDAAIGESDSFARRIARNTQSLLLDEANLGRVTDAAGGSWYVESLTESLAVQAWAWFQEIERAGGIVDAIAGGVVEQRITTTWMQRLTNIARRKDTITGVSEFPNSAETPVTRPPHAVVDLAGNVALAPHRYAEAFEALRDRADAAPLRPTVFLANLGPIAVHTARAMFTTNFFEIAGIAVLGNDGFESPVAVEAAFAASGAQIACICSSDAVYAERAEATARALHDAGARRVYLAGRHEAPGVDEHLYTGCDALATLTRALEVLEISEVRPRS